MPALHHRPKFSDDHLLATVFLLGANASDVTVCAALEASLGAEIGCERVVERLRRLQATHMVSFSPSPNAAAPKGAVSIRLTASGVDRLCSLQREPLAPDTH